MDKVGQGGGLVEEGEMIKVFQKDGKIQLQYFEHKMRVILTGTGWLLILY